MTMESELRRQIGQLLVFGFDGTVVPEEMKDLIRTHYLGNVILFTRNVSSIAQLQELNADLQRLAYESGHSWPLTISADQENGIVRRMPKEIPGLPGNMALGATENPENARRSGELTARILLSLGVNFNLAPVLDVNNNPQNPVIGVRSFSDVPEMVASFGRALIEGLQSQGVIACGKHFPGHGDTNVDSHLDLPTIPHDKARLKRVELVPFETAIEAGVDVLMTAHVVFPAVEPTGIPATLSRRVLTDLLRQQLGFAGVITTDCLEMNAISETIGTPKGAVEALKAGADLVMVSHRLDRQRATIEAIVAAVQSGDLSEDRINDAFQRVVALKERRLRTAPASNVPSEEAGELQLQLSKAALTRLTNGPSLPKNVRSIAVLSDETAPVMVAAGPGGKNPLVRQAVMEVLPGASIEEFSFSSTIDATILDAALRKLATHDAVVIGVNGTQNDLYMTFLDGVHQLDVPQATLLLRSPYDARRLHNAPNLLALYENTPWMVVAAVREAFHGGTAAGALPVEVSDEFPRGYHV